MSLTLVGWLEPDALPDFSPGHGFTCPDGLGDDESVPPEFRTAAVYGVVVARDARGYTRAVMALTKSERWRIYSNLYRAGRFKKRGPKPTRPQAA